MKTRIMLYVGTASAIAIATLFNPDNASCCTCIPIYDTAKEEMDASDVVISGRITAITENRDRQGYIVTVAVHSSWKEWEASLREVTMFTFLDDARCGERFACGDEYLIFGNWDNNELFVHSCSRTKLMLDATKDLGEIGDPIFVNVEGGMESCGTLQVAEGVVLGVWEVIDNIEDVEWENLKFNPGGICLGNRSLEGKLVSVGVLAYERSHDVVVDGKVRQKIVFKNNYLWRVRDGSRWVELNHEGPVQLWCEFVDGKMLLYPRELVYMRSLKPVYGISEDGEVTSVNGRNWGEIKKKTSCVGRIERRGSNDCGPPISY